ncbi:MAG: family 16 glycoside hydrolase, partial [Thermoguttaceae bacterium]
VQADQVVHPVSRLLTGACIEDVNHEIYGGIYSQMIFGESFQEPPTAPAAPIKGFNAFGGNWRVRGEELQVSGSPGDRLVSELPAFTDGEVGVEVFVPDRNRPNAGLIVRVAKPGNGVDSFNGYEIALNAVEQNVRLGRHRHKWELIKDTPCEVPIGQWVPLVVKLSGRTIEVLVNGKSIVRHEDGNTALLSGTIGLRQFQPEAQYRKLWVKTGSKTRMLTFESASAAPPEVSGMWREVQRGAAAGTFTMEKSRPFVGQQSQRLTFSQGQGEIGVENQGLNRWGMDFVAGKPYEGYVWVRAEQPTTLFAALESREGSQVYAETTLAVAGNSWQRLYFTLTPSAADKAGRLALKLKQPGSIVLGHAFLQPGEWGRFKGLPVRRDVAEGLVDQGITVLRYGGSMVNQGDYKWKKMIGPRDRRPPYAGTWYRYSSNGWGIPDFMNFCEAAGFEYIPAFNMGETPQDMADFIQYAKGPAESQWGRRRVADGHSQPYRLRYMELGNEERVDENYFQKFKALAETIWTHDPQVTIVVGDFVYGESIRNPLNFHGAASGITSLAAQQKILRLAKQHDREVWFDLHVGTDGPRPDSTLAGTFSFIDALERLADGARFKVAVFEFNAGNHAQRRALANALAINAVERDGRIKIVTSANCLQPDRQNDNDWDQGLLFLNPSQVWFQPPGYVTQMFSRNYLPQLVKCRVTGAEGRLDVNATRSDDGKTLVLQVVNSSEKAVAAGIHLAGFVPGKPTAQVSELSGPLDAVNTADKPRAITPQQSRWKHEIKEGSGNYIFPPHSVTVIRFD